MSLNPVYLWNPQNFPDQQAMLPDGFDAAHRIVSEWADQPLPQGADTSAFDKLAGYIAEAARSGKASADFKAAYADIETQVAEQAKENALSSSMGCFMKGTLVETEEGWTPIDELKVGDWVMSRPENGIGEAVPKRVVNTFRYEDKEVVMLKFSCFPNRNGGATLVATPNHPFCVYGVVTNLIVEHPEFGKLGAYWKGCDYDSSDMFNGPDGWEKYDALSAFEKNPYEMRLYEQPVWKRADQLERGDVVLGLENDYYVVEDYRPLYAYRDTDQAWIQPTNLAYGWKESDLGNTYEMVLDEESRHRPTLDWADVPNDENLLYVDEDGQRHYRRYRTTVYNIEVEDYHTYCVGYQCILVHNQNLCRPATHAVSELKSKRRLGCKTRQNTA